MGRGLIQKRVSPFFTRTFDPVTISGINPSFPGLSQTFGQITHVLLTRAPLENTSTEASVIPRSTCMRQARRQRSS
jgi:hypothetical protein